MVQIIEHMEKESPVISIFGRTCKNEDLERVDYSHFIVNRKYNLVEWTIGSRAEHIESLWGSTNWQNNKALIATI